MLGKQELVAKGHFDDIDMAMMIHTASASVAKARSAIAESSNGALIKQVRFIGRAAHAGSAPQLGVNALNAAMLAMNAIARPIVRPFGKKTPSAFIRSSPRAAMRSA